MWTSSTSVQIQHCFHKGTETQYCSENYSVKLLVLTQSKWCTQKLHITTTIFTKILTKLVKFFPFQFWSIAIVVCEDCFKIIVILTKSRYLPKHTLCRIRYSIFWVEHPHLNVTFSVSFTICLPKALTPQPSAIWS